MRKNLSKYFWDGDTNISEEYKLRRILEYASFPDLITYPVEEVKKILPAINIDNLRTSQKRKEFLKLILPFLPNSHSWDEIINKLIKI